MREGEWCEKCDVWVEYIMVHGVCDQCESDCRWDAADSKRREQRDE